MSDPNFPTNPYGEQPNPYGQPTGQPVGEPPAYGGQPYGSQPYGQTYGQTYGSPAGGDPDKRPGTVTAAGALAIVFSTISLVLFGLIVVGIAVARDDVQKAINDELSKQTDMGEISASDLTNLVLIVMLVCVFWAICGIVLGVLTLKRHNWARIMLVVSSGFTAAFCLLGITSLISGIPLIAAVATIVLLFTGGANEWFSRRSKQVSPY